MKSKFIKKILIGFGIFFIVLIVVFLAGPRVEIDTTIHPINLPPDLDKYLEESEAAFDDLFPDTGKIIIWAGKPGVQTPLSVVFLHGYGGNRQMLSPLPETVAKMLGANLFCTRFTGHGRNGDDLMEGSVNAWLNDAMEAIEIGRRLGKKVVLFGQSNGANPATWLATQPVSKNLDSLVLISPCFDLADSRAHVLLLPWGGQIAELLVGKEIYSKPPNEEFSKYSDDRSPTKALLPLMGLTKLIKSLNLSAIDSPTLILYSPNDKVVSIDAIKDNFTRIGASRKELVPYTKSKDPSQHGLAGRFAPGSTEDLAEIIVNFVRNK